MSDLTPEDLRLATEMAHIASGPGTVANRGEQVLGSLQRLLEFDAGAVHVFDAQRHEYATVAAVGYDEATRKYMQSSAFADDVELIGLHKSGAPVCSRSLPTLRTDLRMWTDYVEPAGLREGFGVGLFFPGGRRLGLITAHRRDPVKAGDATCRRLALLAPTVANAVDPTRNAALLARSVTDADAGVVRSRDGTTTSLPGLPAHHMLDDRTTLGSRILDIVDGHLAAGEMWISFLCPAAHHGDVYSHLKITAVACPPEVPFLVAAVVLVSPPGDLFGLTRRELDILGLIVTGWPNGRIATALYITERTVAAHMEHILAKLSVASRTLAAVRAQRAGLYVPIALGAAA